MTPTRRCDFCAAAGVRVEDGSCCATSAQGVPVAVSVGGKALRSVTDWFESCPPRGGARQWHDGYSAKESAKSWFRNGHLGLPEELATLLDSASDLQGFTLGTVIPEVCTKLDEYGHGRNADAVVMGLAGNRRTLIAIEAKAAEDFGPQIGARLQDASEHGNVAMRIDALAKAVFGRSITPLDTDVAGLRYQLLHALAGALIEARSRGADQAVFAVQYFPNLRRPSTETFRDFKRFVSTLVPGADIVPGTALRVQIHGSVSIAAEIPLFVGWATASSN